jgi:hypothetical protein
MAAVPAGSFKIKNKDVCVRGVVMANHPRISAMCERRLAWRGCGAGAWRVQGDAAAPPRAAVYILHAWGGPGSHDATTAGDGMCACGVGGEGMCLSTWEAAGGLGSWGPGSLSLLGHVSVWHALAGAGVPHLHLHVCHGTAAGPAVRQSFGPGPGRHCGRWLHAPLSHAAATAVSKRQRAPGPKGRALEAGVDRGWPQGPAIQQTWVFSGPTSSWCRPWLTSGCGTAGSQHRP